MNDIQSAFVLNAFVVFVLQHLKQARWFPFLTTETEKANRWVSAALATLASAGIVFTVAHTGSGGTGTITLSYAGLTTMNVAHFLVRAIGNYAGQKVIYKLAYGNGGRAVAPLGPSPNK
jgi:hypothetical protein